MALPNSEKPKEKKFKIQNLPESIRKQILAIIVVILMLIIIAVWFNSLKNVLKPIEDKPRDENWEVIQKDLSNFLNAGKQNLNAIKDQLSQLVSPTTTPTTTIELAPEELEKLKEKLEELKTED